MLRKLTRNEDGYGVACSRRSDSGEWWEVKKEMKSRGETWESGAQMGLGW